MKKPWPIQTQRTSIPSYVPPRSLLSALPTDPEKPGFAIIYNIVKSGFKGRDLPRQPRARDAILGLPCYTTLNDIEANIDLAVIAIPAYAVLGTLWKCARLSVGVRGHHFWRVSARQVPRG